MCGIFGAIGEYNPSNFIQLALLNETRGKDSCGFYNGKFIAKEVGLVRDNLLFPMLQDTSPRFIMGHTRNATKGAVTKDNAHPFICDNIAGTHNGAVWNFDELKKTFEEAKDLEVDSEIIFWGINRVGLLFLREIRAYWGLAWHDRRNPHIIYLSTHKHHLAAARYKNSFYYSSDVNDLRRIGLTPFELQEDYIYTVDINTIEVKKLKMVGLQKNYSKHYSHHSSSQKEKFNKVINGTFHQKNTCLVPNADPVKSDIIDMIESGKSMIISGRGDHGTH